MSNFVFLSWRFHSQYYYCKKKARKSFEKKTSLTLWESSISKKKLTYILKLMYCRLVWLNKKLIVIIYLSIRTFAIWILPHVVASWSGVEYLGKSIWLTSSPRLSLSKTSSRFPAIAASFRFFDIFLFFFPWTCLVFQASPLLLLQVRFLLQLSVRPLIVFPELPWLLSLLVSLKLIQSVRRKLTHTFWNGRPKSHNGLT